jgi:hypothetical protein
MQIVVNFLFLFSLLNSQVEGRYERHNQSCGGMNGTDIKWNLEIMNNKTYTLQITERKNEYSSKPKMLFIGGTWESIADTLKLSDWAKKEDVLVFYKNEGRLIFQRSKSKIQNRNLVYLDYLERLKE